VDPGVVGYRVGEETGIGTGSDPSDLVQPNRHSPVHGAVGVGIPP